MKCFGFPQAAAVFREPVHIPAPFCLPKWRACSRLGLWLAKTLKISTAIESPEGCLLAATILNRLSNMERGKEMASFMHIADKDNEQAIQRNGIKKTKCRSGITGVHAMPIVPNFTTTHQWARELKRWTVRTLICVQFKISDDDIVLIGKYNGDKVEMTAAEAVGAVLDHTDPMGLEVLIPRRIAPKEITRTYLAPRITGWRYYPSAKGKPPFCGCKWCNRGEIRAQRLIREE